MEPGHLQGSLKQNYYAKNQRYVYKTVLLICSVCVVCTLFCCLIWVKPCTHSAMLTKHIASCIFLSMLTQQNNNPTQVLCVQLASQVQVKYKHMYLAQNLLQRIQTLLSTKIHICDIEIEGLLVISIHICRKIENKSFDSVQLKNIYRVPA